MADDASRRVDGPDGATQEGEYAAECYACPIGTVAMAMQKAAPETSDHLLRAGREFLLALRTMIDGLGEVLTAMEEKRPSAAAHDEVQTIPIRRRS